MKTPSSTPNLRIAAVLGGALVLSALPLLWMKDTSQPTVTTPLLETALEGFRAKLSKDLERAGCDPTRSALLAYQEKSTGKCVKETFHYGLVKNPTVSDCKTKLGELGILSYQGFDVNRDGVFFPEEGLNLKAPELRPPAPKGIRPTPPNPLPADFYNDYIVYAFDEKEQSVVRKNLGSLSTTKGDSSAVLLRNVLSFQVEFDEGAPMLQVVPNEGTFFDRVTVHVLIRAEQPEPGFENPRLDVDSPYRHHRTAERNFTYRASELPGCSF